MSSYLLSSQGDRMAMANAIEGRYPFLDYRIIEFCASLPPKMKTNGLTEKYLLKKHMYSKLPEEVVARQKQAYRAPIHTSFIPRLNTGYADRLLSSEKINEYNIFDATNSARFISELRTRGTGSEIEAMALAGILSGQLFFDQFIAGNRPNKRSILSPPEITNRKSI
jgi:asparagine synthase (glutamine-hydrolysing)